MLMASNSRVTLNEVKKYSENTCVQKRNRLAIQPADFNELGTGSGRQSGYSKNFEKIYRKTSVVIFFLAYQ